MSAGFIKSQILKSKELILNEAKEVHGFMDLLMIQRNTGSGWTGAEKVQLKRYIARLAAYIPILIVFLLPGGFALIPLLAEVLDRRNHRRHTLPESPADTVETPPKPSPELATP
jgi:hypothetical protein